MEHLIIKPTTTHELSEMVSWLPAAVDGELFDYDVLRHGSSFILTAFDTTGERRAYLPIQQPLMLENLICRPGLADGPRAQTLSRLVEYAIGEAYRRDVGELYFLTRDQSTKDFAERHHFEPLPYDLKVYRLNLLETFGG